MGGADAIGQFGRPGATGDAMDARRKAAVHAAHHAILFMNHARQPHHHRRRQRRNGGIAAKADHDGGPVPAKPTPRRQHACGDPEGRGQLARQPAARGGGGRDDFARDLGREGPGIARTAIIGGQRDAPTLGQQQLGQRLGRKHMPAGATGGNQRQRCMVRNRRHQRPRRSNSPSSPCGRDRVSASNMPTAIPEAITDEPP